MQKSEKRRDILQSQMSAENQNTNKQPSGEEEVERLLERDQVKGSPFWIVGNKEEGYCLTYGKYRFTEFMPTKEEVTEHLMLNQYNIIAQMIFASVNEDAISFRKELEQENKDPL